MPRTLLVALAALGVAASATLPAVAQDGPVATSPEAARPPRPAQPSEPPPTPAPAPVLGQSAASAPTDDYGYVAWCYGAVSGYVDLYDTAMPEVTRIERAFPTPSTEENISKVYPEQRDAAKASLTAYQDAMTAAEKASPQPINVRGGQAINRGRGIWAAARTVTKAQLGQFWMGWAAPADCDTRAKTLLTRSNLFGQALSFNAAPVPDAPTTAAAETPTGIDALLAPAATTDAPATDGTAAGLRGPL